MRAAAVLDRLRAQREVAQEELDRAFPHGRPEGDAGKGYDDRARQVAENDRLIKTLEDRLREPGAAPKPPKPAPKYPPGFGSTMKKIEAGTHPFEWGADLMQQARAAGFTPDQLHAAAQEMQAKNESTYREHNELHDSLKAAIRRQYPELSNQQFGKMYKKVLAEGDSTQIRNFDVIQQNHNDRIDMGFADPADTSKTLDQEERFWKVLQAGHHEKLPQEVAYSNGLKHLLADRATGAAQNAALRSGQPAAAVEASLRSGEAAGLRKAAEQARQESESAGGARPPGPGAEAPEGTQRPGGPEVPAAGTTGPGTTPDYGAQSPGINRALHNLADHIAADHAPGGGANEQQSGGGLKEPGIRNFFTDESGAVDVDRVRKAVKGAFLDAKDGLMEMAGASFPALHRLSERVGVEVSRMANAQNYLKVRTPLMIDQVLGPNAKEDFQNLMGATVNERRLRWMKNASLAEANIAGTKAADLRDRAVQETDPERRADMLKAATEYARQSTEWLSKKNKIISLIGTDNFPLKTFEDYKRAVKSPEFEAMLDRSTRHMTPEMERNFRDAFGMEDDDPINSWSQVRRGGIVEPFNFKAIEPGDDSPTAAFVMGRNNFKNLKAGKYVFGEEASGSAPAYEYNMAKLIENSMAKGYPTAAKARALRAMVEEGVGRFDKPGQGKKGEVEFPFTNPPKDMGLTEGGPASLYLPEGDPAREWSRALGLNTRYDQKLFPRFLHAITGGALKSTVEATWHVANNLTALLKSGVHPWDLVVEGINILRKDESTRERLADLAMIGAKTAQERGSNWNPFNYLTRFVHIVQDAQRLTLDNAFNRLVARPDFLGGAVNSASNRRDFINTLGQYNKRTQNEWVALARDTGVGDFATAGTNFAVNSARSMVGGQGVKTRTVAGDIALRTEYLTKVAALLGGIGLANYLRWGNPLGDDQTPLGAYKVGEDNGRTSYIELAKIFAAPVRGLRETGILAYLDGWRHKQDPGTATDRARDAAVQAVLHPFFGPGAQFLHTVATGKDVLGRQVAEPAKYGHSQTWEDLKAAMWHINPSVATIAGKDQPGHEPTVGEKIGAAFGPFGVKTKGPSKPDEVLDFYRAMHADETQQQLQRRANTAKGLATKRPAIQEFFRRTAAAINKLELAHNNPATAEEAKPAIREQQRRLAIQAMEIRKRELGE